MREIFGKMRQHALPETQCQCIVFRSIYQFIVMEKGLPRLLQQALLEDLCRQNKCRISEKLFPCRYSIFQRVPILSFQLLYPGTFVNDYRRSKDIKVVDTAPHLKVTKGDNQFIARNCNHTLSPLFLPGITQALA